MGIKAMSWAFDQDVAQEPNQRFVLIALSNWISDEDGDGAFPAINTLCRVTGLANSTVRRKLQELRDLGLIVEGNQDLAAAYISRQDRRPTVWKFSCFERPLTIGGRVINDRSPEPPRPLTDEITTAQAMSDDPSKKTIRNPAWGVFRPPTPKPEELAQQAEEARTKIRELSKQMRIEAEQDHAAKEKRRLERSGA